MWILDPVLHTASEVNALSHLKFSGMGSLWISVMVAENCLIINKAFGSTMLVMVQSIHHSIILRNFFPLSQHCNAANAICSYTMSYCCMFCPKKKAKNTVVSPVLVHGQLIVAHNRAVFIDHFLWVLASTTSHQAS
jgi:hypothetical protein